MPVARRPRSSARALFVADRVPDRGGRRRTKPQLEDMDDRSRRRSRCKTDERRSSRRSRRREPEVKKADGVSHDENKKPIDGEADEEADDKPKDDADEERRRPADPKDLASSSTRRRRRSEPGKPVTDDRRLQRQREGLRADDARATRTGSSSTRDIRRLAAPGDREGERRRRWGAFTSTPDGKIADTKFNATRAATRSRPPAERAIEAAQEARATTTRSRSRPSCSSVDQRNGYAFKFDRQIST